MTDDRRRTLLIAGGSFADIPMIRAAQALGFRVITSGNRPEDAGHSVSDQYCPADFSDGEAMLGIARAQNVDFVCPSCNDFSAISCAFVAEEMGLPGHDPLETSLTLHHKDRFRDYAASNGLPSPRSRSFKQAAEAKRHASTLRWPVIVKPVDLTGGKGIGRVGVDERADAAIDRAFSISRAGRIVIEEFVEGSNHGFTCFLRKGQVIFHFFDDEYYYLNRYLVSAASAPGSVPVRAIERLIEVTECMAEQLRLVDGVFHVQFVLSGEDPVLIEVCRRPPGDLYVSFVSHATGVDYPALIVKGYVEGDTSSYGVVGPSGCFARHCIMCDRAGTVLAVDIDDRVQKLIIDSYTWWKPGYRVQDHLVQKLGIVFLRYPDRQQMLGLTASLQDLIKPRMQA